VSELLRAVAQPALQSFQEGVTGCHCLELKTTISDIFFLMLLASYCTSLSSTTLLVLLAFWSLFRFLFSHVNAVGDQVVALLLQTVYAFCPNINPFILHSLTISQ